MELVEEILAGVRSGAVRSKDELQRWKLEVVRRRGAGAMPSDADLLAALGHAERARFRDLLRTKSTRTLSGVAIVAVQTSPSWCPHGTCTYCPGGPDSHSAKSYTGFEPAALRAGRHGHDPYAQVADRVRQLRAIGHDTDKVDLILMGGTLPARDLDYQQWFAKRCYDALNDDGTPTKNRYGGAGALTVEEAMARNEAAPNRCIGLTVETKPDWCMAPHLDTALGFGATRIELGVQTTHEDILQSVHRGHTLQDTVTATRLTKDAGLKLVYHMMPGLPGSNPARDMESFRRIFQDPDFRPDMLKIYPTLVVPGTPLYEEWRRGAYRPYTTDEAADVIVEAKRLVPPWVRIQRVDRDIPTPLVAAGVDKSNLREVALARLRERYGVACGCIRCREVGFRDQASPAPRDQIVLHRDEYEASGGREVFLSLEDADRRVLYAYLRLRLPHAPHRPELAGIDHAMIRELKVHGRMVPLGRHDGEAAQHRGLGQQLLEEAARVTFEDAGAAWLYVLSGVGVKPYYRRLGFTDAGVYLRRGPS
jgi:elongator complex protein 3